MKVSGNELKLMLAGKKPMAAFCRCVGEDIDETGGQDFAKYVAERVLGKRVFYVQNPGQSYRVLYTVYYLPQESWRFSLYRELKKIGQHQWNGELEHIEAKLLGYGNERSHTPDVPLGGQSGG